MLQEVCEIVDFLLCEALHAGPSIGGQQAAGGIKASGNWSLNGYLHRVVVLDVGIGDLRLVCEFDIVVQHRFFTSRTFDAV